MTALTSVPCHQICGSRVKRERARFYIGLIIQRARQRLQSIDDIIVANADRSDLTSECATALLSPDFRCFFTVSLELFLPAVR